jgi:hypothetical protein
MQAETHLNALLPDFYIRLKTAGHMPDAVVMSPWFAVLDIALPLAVRFALSVVCAHVPGHYLTDATAPRLNWLRSLKEEGRLATILGLPKGPMGRRCVWLLIFRDAFVKSRLLRTPFGSTSLIL